MGTGFLVTLLCHCSFRTAALHVPSNTKFVHCMDRAIEYVNAFRSEASRIPRPGSGTFEPSVIDVGKRSFPLVRGRVEEHL